MVSGAIDNGVLDLSLLEGDSRLYYIEAVKFSELSVEVFSFVDITQINYYFYQYILSRIYLFFESKSNISSVIKSIFGSK